MKRFIAFFLCAACLLLAACQTALPIEPEPEVTPAPTERPPAPEYSLCLFLDDGHTRLLPLTPEANEALRDLLDSAELCLDSAEGSADYCFLNDTTTLYLDSAKGLLTAVIEEDAQGTVYRRQNCYRLKGTLDTALLPEWEEPQEHDEIVTLQDLIDQADPALLEEEGEVLETAAYEGSVPASAGNRCSAARAENGAVILRARKLNLTGDYEVMTVQEVKQVQDVLIVSVAVLSDEGSAVTVVPTGDVNQVWFMESGLFMDILTLPEEEAQE